MWQIMPERISRLICHGGAGVYVVHANTLRHQDGVRPSVRSLRHQAQWNEADKQVDEIYRSRCCARKSCTDVNTKPLLRTDLFTRLDTFHCDRVLTVSVFTAKRFDNFSAETFREIIR